MCACVRVCVSVCAKVCRCVMLIYYISSLGYLHVYVSNATLYLRQADQPFNIPTDKSLNSPQAMNQGEYISWTVGS